MRLSRSIMACLVLGGMGHAARAALITNGGFETETPPGCTAACSPSGWSLNAGATVDDVFPHSGTYDVALGTSPLGAAGTLSQMVATTAGQGYALSFYVLDESGSPADTITVSFGGFSSVINGSDVPGGYVAETFRVPAASITSAVSTLLFSAVNDTSSFNVDDVALVATPAVATPEPGADAILSTGLIAFVLLRMLRRLPRPAARAFVTVKRPFF